MTNPVDDLRTLRDEPNFQPLKQALINAMVRSGVAGSAGDMTHPCQAHEVAEVVVREVHRLVSVYQDYAAKSLEDRERQTSRWVDAAAQLDDLRYNLALRAFTAPDADTEAMLASLDSRISDALAERDVAEFSRRDWAAEAARLSWIHEQWSDDLLVHPRVCACVTDDQASQLGPGFTRPVCAVHPSGPRVLAQCSQPVYSGMSAPERCAHEEGHKGACEP